jgi:hypothetical protein
MARFSKTALLNELEKRITAIKTDNGFDLRGGTTQLFQRDTRTVVEYGKMQAYISLFQDIRGDAIKE